MSKIMNVFYAADCLPYKDKERQVHYPIVGQGFQGASNTTEIKFYIDQIGAIDDSWVAIAKLPNGKVGSKLLSDSGEDENGRYVSLQLSSFYTQYVGSLFISLQGYRGGVEVEYDSETELYVIHGTPTIEATGPIKLAINYSTQYNGSDEDEQITVQEALAIVSTKLDKNSPRYFKVVNELPDVVTDQDLEYLNVGDILYSKSQGGFFRIVALSPTPIYNRLSASFDDLTTYGDLSVGGDTTVGYIEATGNAEFYGDVVFDNNIDVGNNIFIPSFDYIKDGGGNTLKDELDGKVNKTSGLNQVHVTNGSGQETTIGYSEQGSANLVLRKANGQVYVPTEPLLPNDAASRQFVLDKVAEYGENEIQVVSELPQTGVEGIIYLLPIDPQDLSKGYQRYIYENNTWLSLGTTEVDLSDYQKKLVAGTNIGINQTTNVIKVSDNPTFNTITASELRADNTLYQLYLESLSNDKVGMAYTNNDLSSDIRIYQGVPEIINSSSNYQLSVRVGTQDIDIEVKDFNNDTTESISLLEELDKKANVDGNYPTLTSGLADNLTPYSEDSGAEQDNPFISNGTGTNNNQEIVTVGDYGLLKSKNGNTLVVNQQVQNGNFASTSGWEYDANYTSISASNNVLTATITQLGSNYYNTRIQRSIATQTIGHKVLITCKVKPDKTRSMFLCFREGSTYRYANDNKSMTANTWNTFTRLITLEYAVNVVALCFNATTSSDFAVNDTIQVKDFELIDLTQMFNGDVPQDLLDNPSHFYWYYNGSLAYNTGSLVNANGVKLVSTGRNLWDEEIKTGYYLDGTTGEEVASSGAMCSANFCRCIPNGAYHEYQGWTNDTIPVYFYDINKNYLGRVYVRNNEFTTPDNCAYFKLSFPISYGSTYRNDITISIYYTPEQGGEGYDQYYPYETPYELDTGSEVLRSVGSVYDYKEPNGTIHRLVGSYTFTGNETWASSGQAYYSSITQISNLIKPNPNTGTKANISCDVLQATTGNALYSGSSTSGIAVVNTNIWISINDYNDISSLTGKTIYFELAEETTEQGTSFSENLQINDYGMLYWLDSNGVPQGNTIFFPINYKGFIDDMYSRVEGDSSQYAIQSELLPRKDTTRLTQTLVLTGADSEDWSTSGNYASVKRFNLAGRFYCYTDSEHLRGVGSATSEGLTIAWIQDSTFSGITNLSMCFAGTSLTATRSQLILLIPNSEGVSTVEQLRTWLSTHNITVEYEYSKYKLVATLINGVVTYNWEKD